MPMLKEWLEEYSVRSLMAVQIDFGEVGLVSWIGLGGILAT